MKLSETWFVEGYIDFELQKYRLLAYLKEVDRCFNETKLYPQLSDVIFHYNNLVSFREHKKLMQEQFPRQLDQVNLEQLELVYRQMLQDSAIMQEMEDIVRYAIDQMKETIDSGTEIYETVEQHLHINPVGILPLYRREGYVLLRYGGHSEVRAYRYTVTLFEHSFARYKGLRMGYVDSWHNSIVHTYEMIKREIIRRQPELPNPAVYAVESGMQFPVNETLLPVTRRLLVRYIETG